MLKTRKAIAALFALAMVFLMLVVASVVFGWNIPVISDVADMLGLSSQA
jgi:hypothetical protein